MTERLLIFHGYLLRGTGSNVYTAGVAAALKGRGVAVDMLSQERRPLELGAVDGAGDWDEGVLRFSARREPVRLAAYRPRLDGLLPVYVPDRYEGIEARAFPECTDAEIERYVAANVAAVRAVVERHRPDSALANHLVMGPLILARALAGTDIPYAVKIHGSALEYTVRPHPRFLPAAREGLAGASAVLVGSHHTGASLLEVMDDPDLPARTRLGPPGVDLDRFAPRTPEAARAGLARLGRRLAARAPRADASSFAADPERAAAALAGVARGRGPLVGFVGKLLREKGVDVLIEAWPRVLDAHPDAALVLVGFGALQASLEAEVAEQGLGRSVHFTGRLEHAELAEVLPALEALVVPSVFPEAFGMVAIEGAACGAVPIVADHSGLAEVARRLPGSELVATGPGMAEALAERIVAVLDGTPETREERRAGLARAASEHFGWDGVARTVLDASHGRLDALTPLR